MYVLTLTNESYKQLTSLIWLLINNLHEKILTIFIRIQLLKCTETYQIAFINVK